jgi:hypothetical protein
MTRNSKRKGSITSKSPKAEIDLDGVGRLPKESLNSAPPVLNLTVFVASRNGAGC